jgi:hypothetical protein
MLSRGGGMTKPKKPKNQKLPHLAMTVDEFCTAFRISKPFFYKLRSQGLGPREMKLGARTLISMAAADEWRKIVEEPTAEPGGEAELGKASTAVRARPKLPKPRQPRQPPPSLQSATARLRLPVAGKPIWVRLAPGISLGYRRNARFGTWSVRVRGNGAEWIKRIALADDLEAAAPPAVLTYWQAWEQALKLAGAPVEDRRTNAHRQRGRLIARPSEGEQQ